MTARCLDCRYPLKGLLEHRCPECGREFNPDDPSTFDSGLVRRRPSLFAVLLIATCSFVAVWWYMLITKWAWADMDWFKELVGAALEAILPTVLLVLLVLLAIWTLRSKKTRG